MIIERVDKRLSIVHGISTDSLDVVPGHITITMPNGPSKSYYVNFRMECQLEANQGELNILDSNTKLVFSLRLNLNAATRNSSGAIRAAHGVAGDPQNVSVDGLGESFGDHNRINDHQRRTRSRSPSYERLREAPAERLRSPRPYSKKWDHGGDIREEKASKTKSEQRCSAAPTKYQGELGFRQYVFVGLMTPELMNLSSLFQNTTIIFPFIRKSSRNSWTLLQWG